MRIIHYICCLLLFALVSGCAKKSSAPSDRYTITGLSDIAVRRFSDTTFTVQYHIAYPAGLFELVTFNIDDVPPGVTVSPRTASDTTSFSVLVTYHVLMTVAAKFPVCITLYSGSQGLKKFMFNIDVMEAPVFSYQLTLPKDIVLPLYADTILRLPVTAAYTTGNTEIVTISPIGLPGNMTVSPASIAGTPTFTDTFALHVTAGEVSTYQVVMHGTSSQGTQAAGFNVSVEARSDCAPPLADTFSGTTVCAGYSGAGTGISTSNVYVYGTNKLRIQLPFADAVTELNCGTATLNMLPGSAGSLYFAGGTGTFTPSGMVLSYALSGAINATCTTTLKR